MPAVVRHADPSSQLMPLNSDLLWLGLIMIVAFALRMLLVDFSSLWWDEGYSLWFSRLTASDLFGIVPSIEPNPPLYYLLLKAWTFAFGESDMAVRSLSVTISTCTVPLVYLAARWAAPREFSSQCGILAALLFSLSFLQLRYAQEARAYSLLVFALAGALTSATFILRNRSLGKMPSFIPFACLGASMALMLWSHYTGLFYVLALGACAAAWWLVEERRDLQLLLRLSTALLLLLALAAPALWALLHIRPLDVNGWIAAPGFRELALLLSLVLSADLGNGSASLELASRAALFGIWPVIGCLAAWRARESGSTPMLLLMVALSAGVLALMVSVTYLGRPVLLERTLVPIQIGWIVLCSFSPMLAPARWRKPLAAAVVLCFATGSLAYFRHKDIATHSEDWRAMTATLIARSSQHLNVLTHNGGGTLIRHYADRHPLGRVLQVTEVPEELSVDTGRAQLASRPAGQAWFSAPLIESIGSVVTTLKSNPNTWLVLRNPKPDVLASLAREGIVPQVQSGILFAFHSDVRAEPVEADHDQE